MGREALPPLVACCAEWRAVVVRYQVIDREILAPRFEPSQNGFDIFISLVRLNRAEQSVLKQPIKLERRIV